MTEKRFNKVKVYLSYEIFDNKSNEQLGVNKTVDLMNQLNDENEQLKQQLEHIQGTFSIINGYLQDDGVLTLEKYNEIEDYRYDQWKKGDVE